MDKHKIINLFHIFIAVPLLFLLYSKRDKLTSPVCFTIILISFGAMLYHIIRMIDKENKMKWVNLIHVALVFPLLLWIGWNCEKTPRKYFEMILLMAFGGLGYHAYNYLAY